MKLLIARHAEDVGEEFEERIRGLTKKGKKQARALGKVIKKFKPTYLYHSSLLRSKETASIVQKFIKTTVIETAMLNEQDYKDDNRNFMNSKGYIDFSNDLKYGETYKQLYERALKFWNFIQQKHNKFSSDDRIVFITHGRFMTFLILVILDFKPNGFVFNIDNCSYVIINISQNWRPSLVLPLPMKEYI